MAKLHKLGERRATPDRLVDKDAHDIYRLLVAVPTPKLSAALIGLATDDFAGTVTRAALDFLDQLFGRAEGVGAAMAGRAEELVGDPTVVAAACAALAGDLLAAVQP